MECTCIYFLGMGQEKGRNIVEGNQCYLLASHRLILTSELIRVDDFINRVMPEHKSSICDT